MNFLTLNLRILQTCLFAGNCEGPALIGTGAEENACSLGTLASKRKREITYLVSPSELTFQKRSCASSGVACVEVERSQEWTLGERSSIPFPSTFRWKWQWESRAPFLVSSAYNASSGKYNLYFSKVTFELKDICEVICIPNLSRYVNWVFPVLSI